MSYVIKGETMTSIADAIRTKNGTTTQYIPSEMPDAILALGGGGSSELALQLISDRESITEVELPATTRYISDYAFANCENLSSISLPKSLAFIEGYAFYSCYNLVLPSIPDNVASIGQYAFYDCWNLQLASLPKNLTHIYAHAFDHCSVSITSIPKDVTNIYSNAFYMCTGLTTLTFEGTPTMIASDAFEYCTTLSTINVPWAEGKVANAPWGARFATINYNYKG